MRIHKIYAFHYKFNNKMMKWVKGGKKRKKDELDKNR
jgi:hypothetical protein